MPSPDNQNSVIPPAVNSFTGDDILFKKLIENSYSGIALFNSAFKVIYRSPSAQRISGWNITQVTQGNLNEFIHPLDITGVNEVFNDVLNSPGIPKTCKFRSRHLEGDYIWLQCTFTNMLNEADIKAVVCNFIDITEHKKAEDLLQQTVNELTAYKYALDEAAIVAITDQKGIISHVNDYFCRISKYNRDELIGQDHRIINSSYHPKEFIQNLWVTIANGKIWRGELKNKAKDGSHYWVDTTIIPFLDEKEKPYQYIAIRSDITQRKEEEQRSKLLESVITNTTDAVLITDAEQLDEPGPRIIYVNEAFTKMTGYTPEEVIGKTPRILQGAKSDKDELKRLSNAIRNFQPCEITIINYKKNGEEFWVNFSVSPVVDDKGNCTHFIAIEKDITHRKIAEIKLNELNESLVKHAKELAISNAELEQFAYVASHDLQEPLRMVTSFLTQIEKKYTHIIDDKGKQYINFAVDGAKRMRQIILDLLEFSRVGRAEDSVENVDLNKLVNDIIVLYRKKIEEKKAKIIVENLPVMHTSIVPVRQVFQNLISNSLKYQSAEHAPLINILGKDDGDHWKFSIKDNGIGIDPEYFDKIFIIFQRLHNKDEYSGTGMGLAVTKKIIENLGGKIWVESQEGKGSTFYFTILKK